MENARLISQNSFFRHLNTMRATIIGVSNLLYLRFKHPFDSCCYLSLLWGSLFAEIFNKEEIELAKKVLLFR